MSSPRAGAGSDGGSPPRPAPGLTKRDQGEPVGYMRECPVGRIYTGAWLLRIVEGASEIQRMIIARQTMEGSRYSTAAL